MLRILTTRESLSKEMIRESFVSCVITCTTDGTQDDEFTRLKEGKLCHEGRKLLRGQFQLINTKEPTPSRIDEANVDSSNPKILTVQEDEDGDEGSDVQIDI